MLQSNIYMKDKDWRSDPFTVSRNSLLTKPKKFQKISRIFRVTEFQSWMLPFNNDLSAPKLLHVTVCAILHES